MRTANICPTCAKYENALCVLYNGEYLSALDVSPLDSLEEVLVKINAAIAAIAPTTTTTTTTASVTTTTTTTGML